MHRAVFVAGIVAILLGVVIATVNERSFPPRSLSINEWNGQVIETKDGAFLVVTTIDHMPEDSALVATVSVRSQRQTRRHWLPGWPKPYDDVQVSMDSDRYWVAIEANRMAPSFDSDEFRRDIAAAYATQRDDPDVASMVESGTVFARIPHPVRPAQLLVAIAAYGLVLGGSVATIGALLSSLMRGTPRSAQR